MLSRATHSYRYAKTTRATSKIKSTSKEYATNNWSRTTSPKRDQIKTWQLTVASKTRTNSCLRQTVSRTVSMRAFLSLQVNCRRNKNSPSAQMVSSKVWVTWKRQHTESWTSRVFSWDKTGEVRIEGVEWKNSRKRRQTTWEISGLNWSKSN